MEDFDKPETNRHDMPKANVVDKLESNVCDEPELAWILGPFATVDESSAGSRNRSVQLRLVRDCRTL